MGGIFDNGRGKRYNRTPNAERRTPNGHNFTQKLPVRIAHVIGRAVRGGIEASVLNYYKYIDRTKIQYDFLVYDDSTHIPEDLIKSLGGRIIITPVCKKQLQYQKSVYEIFTRNKYPLVYSHISTLSVYPLFAAWRADVPLRVSHAHTTAGRGPGEFKRNVMKYCLRPFAKLFPTHMCACSRLAGEFQFGRRAVDSGRVKIWPNAIETERYAYNESVRNDVRASLGLSDKFIIGHSGRFTPQKNHGFLVDIFAEIRRRREDSVLLLAGDGPLMDSVREKVSRMGMNDSVIFLGNVHDMEKYYQAMDVFILPSLYEGLPVVGSEVQVSGLPFLCSDRVTPEAKFCDNLCFMSLRKSACEWADEALRISDGHVRRDMSIYAKEAGFDIRTQAGKMSDWYCSLLRI